MSFEKISSYGVQSIPKAKYYFDVDKESVAKFNTRHAGTKYELQMSRGAKCGGGDILNAKLLLLYANPGYNPEVDTQNQIQFSVRGWPLAALHPSANTNKRMQGAHKWLSTALSSLTERYGGPQVGGKFIAQNVATINIVPWSSTSYHASCLLPSREMQLNVARHAARCGALLIAVRARKAWKPLLDEFPDQVIYARSPLTRHISPGNLGPDNWLRAVTVLDAAALSYFQRR